MDPLGDESVERPSVKRTASPAVVDGSPLVGLPHDLLQNLFKYLDITDRLQLAYTCKTLYDIYINSKILQYDFILQTNAYIDVPARIDYNADGTPAYVPYTSIDDLWIRGEYTDGDQDDGDGIPARRQSLSNPAYTAKPIPSVTVSLLSEGEERHTVMAVSTAVQRRTYGASASPFDKMLFLNAQEAAWETLSPRQTKTIKIRGPEGVYELQEGIFLMCDDYSREEGRKPRSIRLIPLPSTQDPDWRDTALPIKSHQLKFAIADLTMDPTQDLIVVSEDRTAGPGPFPTGPTHRYHLFTLSDFTPHPLADLAFIEFPPAASAETNTRQLLQIMGDTLVILVSRYQFNWIFMALAGVVQPGMNGIPNMNCEEELVCWNWKTGKVLARMQLPENGWFASFALLTPTTFMITSTSNISPIMGEPTSPNTAFPPVISIYSFLPDPKYPVNPSQPLGSVYIDDTTPRPILVAQLEMPRLAPNVSITSFEVRPDPAFPVAPTPGVGQRKAYTQDPEKGVLVFELKVNEPPNPELNRTGPRVKVGFELFVLRETLVKLAQEGEQRIREQRDARDGTSGEYAFWRVEKNFPWSEWGKKNARFQDMSMRNRAWVCSCSGYRYVDLVSSDDYRQAYGRREEDKRRRALSGGSELEENEVEQAVMEDTSGTDHPMSDDELEVDAEEVEEDDDDDDSFRPLRPCHIRVLDFSPIRLRRPLWKPAKESIVTTRTVPTVLSKRRIWTEDVITTLPYTEVIQTKSIIANGIMIDDQRVIVIKTHETPDGDRTRDRQELTVLCM